MVNGDPREVPRPKPEGPQAPRVLTAELSEGLEFHHDTPKDFSQIFILLSSRARIRNFFQLMDSLVSPLDFITALNNE